MAIPLKAPIMREKIRIAVVGCGRIAQSHLEALGSATDAHLEAVVEVRPSVGEAVAEQNRCRLYADHRDPTLLERIDAVILCTPPSSHHALARHFLEHGIHVLCEKPLTLGSSEAQDLVDLSEERGTLLMMASKFRYADDIVKARAILQSGILGNVILYENTFCSRVPMRDRWNAQRETAGGGVLIDNGSHSVDIARYLLGPIRDVQAQIGVPAQALEVEDTARLQFRTVDGVIGLADLSWSIQKESDVFISVFGADGNLLIGWSGSRYRQEGSSKWIPFGKGYDKLQAFRRQLGNFLGTLRGSEMPLITARDALASVQTIEAAYVSAGRDNWVRVGVPS